MGVEEATCQRPGRWPEEPRQGHNSQNQEGTIDGELSRLIFQPTQGRQATWDGVLDGKREKDVEKDGEKEAKGGCSTHKTWSNSEAWNIRGWVCLLSLYMASNFFFSRVNENNYRKISSSPILLTDFICDRMSATLQHHHRSIIDAHTIGATHSKLRPMQNTIPLKV